MTELVKVQLSKDWSKHKSGSTVVVDSVRAEWLNSNGYVEKEPGKKSGRVPKSKKN